MSIFNFGFLNPFANGAPSNEIEAFPDENRGLGIAFDQTEGKPEMKGLNGLFNKITQSLLSIKQNGLIGWTNDIEYIAGGFTVEGGKLYQAIRNNTNKQPSLSQSDWSLWSPISSISVSTNGNLKRTVDANGAMTLEVPTASDTQRGAVRFANATEVANKQNVQAAINPANVGQTFGGSLSANGWCMLPNGLIMQWGVINVTSSGQQFSYPIAFTTVGFAPIIGAGKDTTSTAEICNYISYSRTGFVANASAAGEYPYFVIGR